MTVLSIDSGIERTGYAVFANKKYVTSALIKTSKTLPTEIRLKEIYLKLKMIVSGVGLFYSCSIFNGICYSQDFQITLTIFKFNGVDLLGHGRGANFILFAFLD